MKALLFLAIQLISFFSLSISSAQTQDTTEQNQEPIYDRACFVQAFERTMDQIVGAARNAALPEFIDTRTEYMTFWDSVSGGGLGYLGICGLPENEKKSLIHACLQDELDNVEGGIIELPLEIDSDEKFKIWLQEISSGAASFTGACEI